MPSDTPETRSSLNPGQLKNKPFQQGSNHLLVIGIDAYVHWPQLNNAVRDAKAFRDLLLESYGFDEKRTFALFDADATKDNILSVLRDFEEEGAHQLSAADNLLIYFAGHGAMNPKQTTGYWIPVKAPLGVKDRHKFLSNAELKESLEQIGAHHIYIVSDACFSGSLITRSDGVEKLYENKASRRVLTSGQLEKVMDGPPGGHSPFAEALLACLRDPGEALLSQELEARVVRHYLNALKKLGHTLPEHARPVASHLTGLEDDGGQFVFRPLHLPERHWQQARTTDSLPGWLDYVRRYRLLDHEPESGRVIEALERIEALAAQQPAADPAEMRRLKESIGSLQADLARLKKEKAALDREKNQENKQAQAQLTELHAALEQAPRGRKLPARGGAGLERTLFPNRQHGRTRPLPALVSRGAFCRKSQGDAGCAHPAVRA